MRPTATRTNLARTAVVIAAVLALGCESPTDAPTVDAAAQFAKGGGGPRVEGATPSEGAQGSVNLKVRITGSGFDSGSNAVWLRDGVPAPDDVQTNFTTFVSKSVLIADITIDDAAPESLYDIEVTTRRGKQGVGFKLFSVKKPGEVEPTYSITYFGEGSARLISDAGVVAGTIDGEPFLWTAAGEAVPLPPVDGLVARYVADMTKSGAYLVANPTWEYVQTKAPVRWELDGTTVLSTMLLERGGLDGWGIQVISVNESGQAVGQAEDADPPPPGEFWGVTAVLWQADGSMATLPFLPGGYAGVAWAMNNSGHIVGQGNENSDPTGHAVLWIDTESGYRAIDLGVRFDDFSVVVDVWDDYGIAGYVSEVVDGVITVEGEHPACPDSPCDARWTVHAGTGDILTLVRFSDDAPDLAPTLQALDPRCDISIGDINAGGVIVGSSPVKSKGRCDSNVVIWTPIGP